MSGPMDATVDTTVDAAPAANDPPPPPHPVRELLGRYAAIFKAAWAVRHELAGPKRLADERAFLPAALSLQETPVHPAPRRFAIAICSLFLIAVVWSIFGLIDIVAVAPGRIVVSERTKVIQPLEVSVVRAILVKDGDRVQAGQVLVELDATRASADQASVTEQLSAATDEAERAEALLNALAGGTAPNGGSPRLRAEWSDITAKRSAAGRTEPPPSRDRHREGQHRQATGHPAPGPPAGGGF